MSGFQMVETIAIAKAQPFDIQPSKSPDFKWPDFKSPLCTQLSRISTARGLNGRLSVRPVKVKACKSHQSGGFHHSTLGT